MEYGSQAARAASALEIGAARLWNLLNEGRSFHPIFSVSTFALYHLVMGAAFPALFAGLAAGLPVLVTYMSFDFPLHLRAALWLPLGVWLLAFGGLTPALAGLSLALYFGFTIVLWGTVYYHWRMGAPANNYVRFWRLVLENSDTTSGNAQEQVPKFLLALAVMEWGFRAAAAGAGAPAGWPGAAASAAALPIGAWLLHRYLFTWRPREPQAAPHPPSPATPPCRRAYVVVVDGCRPDKLGLARTPFLDRLAAGGTVYTRMETVYPARTVVCFSSMFTGAFPREHGMRSNLVLSLGVKCESLFDVLRRRGRRGLLLGCAHLIDAFGGHVRSWSAVCPNDRVDGEIMARARQLVAAENPDLLVVQLIAADQTGHSRGVHYPEYLEKISEADAHIAAFYHWLDGQGLLADAAFVVMADHGQSRGIGGHGHLDEGERYVPFIISGPGIAAGRVVEAPASICSVAATLAHLLGEPAPAKARGALLAGALAATPHPVAASRLTVVLPARNEAAAVGQVIARVPRHPRPGMRVEVVVVDDGSTDGTADAARAAGADLVLAHRAGRGLGAAVRTGLRYALESGADYAAFLDADLEYPPEAIPDLLEPLRAGDADYVMGSRFRGYIGRMRLIRRAGNYALTLIQSLLLGRWLSDGQTGMRALNRRALAALELRLDYNYAQVMTFNLLRKGLRLAEVPIWYAARPDGRSFVRLGPYLRHVVPAVWRELARPPRSPAHAAPVTESSD